MSLYSVQALLILDTQGNRLLTKYYQPPHGEPTDVLTVAQQKKFEKDVLAKCLKAKGDIDIVNGRLVVYTQMADVLMLLVGSADENEAMLFDALRGLKDSINILLEHGVDKQSVAEHYDRVALAVDETVDSGIILETDAKVITSRVTLKASDEPSLQNIDLSEKGLRNMFDFARGKLSQAVRQQFS